MGQYLVLFSLGEQYTHTQDSSEAMAELSGLDEIVVFVN